MSMSYRRWPRAVPLMMLLAASLAIPVSSSSAMPLGASGMAMDVLSPSEAAKPAAPASGPVFINEVSAASWNGAKDEDGEAKDWVELYNPTTYTVDVSRWGLSNKVDSPFRWALPQGTTVGPGKYLIVWLSKKNRAVAGKQLHASFNLDNGADSLYLTQPDGTAKGLLIDSATPALTKADYTWCRMPSGVKTSPFKICAKATQNAANSGDSWDSMVAKPAISPRGGIYSSAQTVTLSGPAGAQVRYTTDGSRPTATSTLYSSPITVSKGMSIRAAAFETGKAPSLDTTESYVIDASGATKFANQRTIMLTMTPSETSSYKAMSKSAVFAPNVDLRDANGTQIFHSDTSGSVAGQIGSRQGQGNTALNISLKDSQGIKDFTYPLFSRKGEQTLDKFRLRNSGSDFWYAHLRDNVGGVAMQNSNSIWSDYAPIQVFLNGQYYGMLDLREREDDTLVESSTGTSKDAVQFYSGSEATAGGKQAETDYKAMINWFKATDMSKPENYAEAQKRVDVQNVAEVTAAFNWSAVWDWPWKNQQIWRSTALDNKWRWKVHDWDITQDSAGHDWGGDARVSYNMYSSRLEASGQDVFKALMKNADFKNLFINAMADDLNTRFSSQTSVARINELADQTRPYIPAFRAQFPSLGTAAQWDSVDITRLRNFSRDRAAVLDTQTRTKFKLSARQPLTVQANDTSMGTVVLNTMDLNTIWTAAKPSYTGSYYPEAPVTLTAKPKAGYRFTGWSGANTSTSPSITLSVNSATSVTATFAKIDAAKPNAPVFTQQGDVTSTTGDYAQIQMNAKDPQGYSVTYSAKKLPKGVDIDPASGKISGRMTTPGAYAVKVTATNGVTSAESSFTWTVEDREGTGTKSEPLTGSVQTEWFKNTTLAGTAAITGQFPLDMDIQSNRPFDGWDTSDFSTRWSTSIKPTVSGPATLRFGVAANDGIRVYLNGQLVLDQWAATNTKAVTYDVPVTLTSGKQVGLTIEFWDKTGDAAMHATWQLPGSTAFTAIPATALTAGPVAAESAGNEPAMGPVTASFWKTATATGTPVSTLTYQPSIGINLASGTAPVPGVSYNAYTARWTSSFTPKADGDYTFRATTSTYDGVRVYVDDRPIIDNWTRVATAKTLEGTATLAAGKAVELRVEYTNYSGDSLLDLKVKVPGDLGYIALPQPSLPEGSPAPTPPAVAAITSEWFNNTTLANPVKLSSTTDPRIAVNVASGAAPFTGFGTAFSARFTSTWTANATGTHTLRVTTGIRDGVRVWVGNDLVLDKWAATNTTRQSFDVPIELSAGQSRPIKVEFTDPSGEAYLDMQMVWPGSAAFQPLPVAA